MIIRRVRDREELATAYAHLASHFPPRVTDRRSDALGRARHGPSGPRGRTISLGAVDAVKAFYAALGYRGRSSWHKDLPLPGRVLDLKLARSSDVDLETGVYLEAKAG